MGWQRPCSTADGEAITLYEHKNQSTHHHGDPIADVFAILARPNSCILAVADGCGWGIKPRLAARCAIHGSMEYLNEKLFGGTSGERFTTQDVFHAIYRSLHTAQKRIIQHGGTTTTLCLAVVVELAEPKAGGNRWGVCVVSVGDTVCYVWRHSTQEVFEVTAAIRGGKERNLRDAGGCLGADMGDHPDLTNLFCCFAPVADHDIVFLGSDGISDNFDPVTLREALPGLSETPPTPPTLPQDISSQTQPSSASQLPALSPGERHNLSMQRLSNLLREMCASRNNMLNATDVKEAVKNFAIEVTEEKRAFLEQVWAGANNTSLTPAERREQDKQIGQTIKQLPGKLDHATVAAYQVGRVVSDEPHQFCIKRPHADTQSFCVVDHPDEQGHTRARSQAECFETYSMRADYRTHSRDRDTGLHSHEC